MYENLHITLAQMYQSVCAKSSVARRIGEWYNDTGHPCSRQDLGHVHREEVEAMVRPYEMMLVLQPGLDEEATDALLERLTGVVTSEGGSN